MEQTMTKSKIIAGTLAALTLTGAVLGTSAPAQAHHHHFGPGFGILAIGALVSAAAAANAEPAYECRYVKHYNRWGHLRVVKICEEDDD
jgi:hypothetical protein